MTKPIPLPSSYLTLSSHSHSRLSFSSLPNSQDFSESDMTIADLDNCIVDLVGQTTRPILTAIHIRNISDTILVLPIIKGSVLLHDIKRCIIVVGCHQVFRMLLYLLFHSQYCSVQDAYVYERACSSGHILEPRNRTLFWDPVHKLSRFFVRAVAGHVISEPLFPSCILSIIVSRTARKDRQFYCARFFTHPCQQISKLVDRCQ